MESETLEQMQARHRRELKDLQGRITSKKKNATKKTRKGVNDECASMERQVRDRQAAEVAALDGAATTTDGDADQLDEESDGGGGALDRLGNKVEDKLQRAAEKLHISPPPLEKPATTANGEEAAVGGGKKRNRQKERLARRAAEQEAAAQRAEEEASTMTDHRARESEYMKKMFQTYNLVEKDIEPDGHCLFSAVADQLAQNGVPIKDDARQPRDELPYKTVRRAAADYMLGHTDDFAPFLEDDLGAYAASVRDTAEWGGQLELMALARRYQVEIRVIQDGRMERIGEEEGKASGKTLWLAYYRHGYGLGEHYNSLRKAK